MQVASGIYPAQPATGCSGCITHRVIDGTVESCLTLHLAHPILVANSNRTKLDIIDDLADELSDITADLVSYREHEELVRTLLSAKNGNWLDLFALSNADSEIMNRLEHVRAVLDSPLWVMWIDHKEPGYNDSFCVILFFAPELLWSNAIIYNRARLLAS